MTKQELIAEVKERISFTKIEEAIEVLEAWLRKSPKYNRFHESAIVLQSKFAKFKEDQTSGILSFEERELTINRLRKDILQLLKNIEKDNLNLTPITKKTNWPLIAGIGFGIILAGLAFFIFFNDTTPPVKPQESPLKEEDPTIKCPNCEPDSLFKIIILPFFNPANDKLKPHGTIKERLTKLSEEETLETCIEIFDEFSPNSYLSKSEATKEGKNCQAEIIVWGRAEKTSDGNLIKTGFQFLGKKLGLEFEELRWENEVKNLKTISEIASGGELTNDLEALIALVFGLTLEEKGDIESAIAQYESIEVSPADSSAHLMKNMRTADAQLKKGNEEAAVAALNTVLEAHPNYWLARNNRAVLNMKNENYLDAADDFTAVLNTRKKDTIIIIEARGKAFLKAEQLKNAETDFEKVLEKEPQKMEIREKLEETRREIQLQENILRDADKEIERNPDNTKAYQKKADAARKLGQYDLADKTIQQAKLIRPNAVDIYASQLELAAATGNTENAKSILEEAENRGINRKSLLNIKGVKKSLKNRKMNLRVIDNQ